MDKPIKVFIGSLDESLSPIFIIRKQLGLNDKKPETIWNFFDSVNHGLDFSYIEITQNPGEADYLMVPYNYFHLKQMGMGKMNEYIIKFEKLSEELNKKTLVFAFGDSDEDIDIKNSTIFRTSQYAYKLKENEIIMPPFVTPGYQADTLEWKKNIWKEVVLRDKSEMPTISFCGWADFPSFYRRLTYSAKVMFYFAKSIIYKNAQKHINGIYFRRKAISILSKSHKIKTLFILRKATVIRAFKMKKSNEINPNLAEKEYIESIINSDFVLSPKGKGNYSLRTYEVLSLGRIPVIVDTDDILPLSEIIDYSKIIIRVKYNDIWKIDQVVLDFYNNLSDSEFKARQKLARNTFEKYLRFDNFLKIKLLNL